MCKLGLFLIEIFLEKLYISRDLLKLEKLYITLLWTQKLKTISSTNNIRSIQYTEEHVILCIWKRIAGGEMVAKWVGKANERKSFSSHLDFLINK